MHYRGYGYSATTYAYCWVLAIAVTLFRSIVLATAVEEESEDREARETKEFRIYNITILFGLSS